MSARSDVALVWFRRDLRAYDHAALHLALGRHARVHCLFVFDTEILAALPAAAARRVAFLHGSLVELAEALDRLGGGLTVRHGIARALVPEVAHELGAGAVYANHDYEPAAIARDEAVREALAAQAIAFVTAKDQVIFERHEILSQAGQPYAVFTPYKRAWLARLEAARLAPHDIEPRAGRLVRPARPRVPGLAEVGVRGAPLAIQPGTSGARTLLDDFKRRIDRYHERRDHPALKGPSYLSAHLRFGTISIRELVRLARARKSEGASTWLSELIWRDFYFMILAHHPHVVEGAYQRELNDIAWQNDEARFAAWCEGRTGYPIVDAGMRQLEQTGYMHNRLRMVVASFLTKDLGIDWRWGERHFAAQLLDHDLAANNGGWQWAASTGCDAQPYFRIFHPVRQSERFDAGGRFIRRYVPELARVPEAHVHAPWLMRPVDQTASGCVIGRDYPAPIVDHAQARVETLERYRRARLRPAPRGRKAR